LELRVMKKAAVTLRLPPELLERVEALAQAERRPLQNLLRNLIDDGIAAQQGRSAPSERVAA
jgi:predicted transcriptional regulator